MPMEAHLTLTGEKQGAIKGSCTKAGREDSIEVKQMDHDIHIPRDPQTGLGSGQRIHGPLTITKEFDRSSPLLYQALCTGEHMKDVTIKWYRIDPAGKQQHYFTHLLTDAIIVAMKPYMPLTFLKENESYRHMEQVSFTYRKIKWTAEVDNTLAEDDWLTPV
jgi:type VI secretion system secreted protein Hcp